MYIYGGEGYLLSERFRRKHPNYVHARTRKGKLGYPFVLNRIEVPKEYGGFIPNAPGTIDAVPHWSMREFDSIPLRKSFLSEKHIEEDKLNDDNNQNQNTRLSSNFSATISTNLPHTSSDGDSVRRNQSRCEKPAVIVHKPNQVGIVKHASKSSRVPSSVHIPPALSENESVPRVNCKFVNNNSSVLPEMTPRALKKSRVEDAVVNEIPHVPSGINGGEIAASVNFKSVNSSCSAVPENTPQTAVTSRAKCSAKEILPGIEQKVVVNSSGIMSIDERAKSLAETVERAELHRNRGSVSDGVAVPENGVQYQRQQVQLQQEQNMSTSGKIPTANAVPNKFRKHSRVDCSSRRKTAISTPLRKPKVIKTAPTMGTNLRKRGHYADPKGMENEHTAHFRNVMFGNNAHKKDAGKGVQPVVNEEAAKGRLFHTVTNIPLDIETYNEGVDSDLEDNGAEVRWRCKCADERLGEVVDMLAIEKYFFALWGMFKCENYFVCNDRDVFKACLQFVQECGGEIRRMKMEVILIRQLVQLWRFGCLDADGFMQILRAFGNCDMSEVVSGVPDSKFEMAHRLLREEEIPFKKGFKYMGSLGVNRVRNEDAQKWLRQEREDLKKLSCNKDVWEFDNGAGINWITKLVKEESKNVVMEQSEQL